MQHGLPASADAGWSARDREKATRAWPLGSNTRAGAGLFCHCSLTPKKKHQHLLPLHHRRPVDGPPGLSASSHDETADRPGRPELTLHLRRRRPVHELTAAPAEIPMVEDVLAARVDGRTEQLLVA
jgi:hypothetical protein